MAPSLLNEIETQIREYRRQLAWLSLYIRNPNQRNHTLMAKTIADLDTSLSNLESAIAVYKSTPQPTPAPVDVTTEVARVDAATSFVQSITPAVLVAPAPAAPVAPTQS